MTMFSITTVFKIIIIGDVNIKDFPKNIHLHIKMVDQSGVPLYLFIGEILFFKNT